MVAIYENGEEISGYEYDFQDQLIRENNKKAGTTKLYTYDEGGNLTEEQIYSYTKEKTIQEEPKKRTTYSYNNKAWKDLLTEYNGENITYDELGNPIQYINGKQFTWVDGRKLTGIQDKENSIQYQYNSDGQRIKKIVNGQETEYNWDEEKMVFQKDKDGYLYFLYNSEDFLIGFEKNGQIYYYERNGLNDISGIYNQSGEKVVTYHYDAWGNVLAIEGDTC